ncbi:MAG: hypothetical protein JJU41_10735 [Bacteroidetes bacterium]|nr:hypothetical protein [Bacteroidota bacterium]MCH8524670.1 hypothetical protein [Balneolales bacterium]
MQYGQEVFFAMSNIGEIDILHYRWVLTSSFSGKAYIGEAYTLREAFNSDQTSGLERAYSSRRL